MPSLTLEDGNSSAKYPLFSQKKRPLGHADVPAKVQLYKKSKAIHK